MNSFERPRKPTSPEQSVTNPNRREFLAGMGAAALVPSAAGAEESAPSYEQERDALYTELQNQMRQHALTSNVEQQRFFLDDGKKAQIIEIPDGNTTFVRVPLDKIKDLLKDPQANVTDLHTHLQKAIDQQAGAHVERTMPPSFMDFNTVFTMKGMVGDDMQRVMFKTIDPYGSWKYGVDWNHPEAKQFEAMLIRWTTVGERMAEDPDVQRELQKFADASGGIDPRVTGAQILKMNVDGKFSRHVSEKISAFEREALDDLRKLPATTTILENEMGKMIDPLNQQEIQGIQKAYASHGLILEFTRYP